jgi:hypothetical protein
MPGNRLDRASGRNGEGPKPTRGSFAPDPAQPLKAAAMPMVRQVLLIAQR